jgi:hypothetical protein
VVGIRGTLNVNDAFCAKKQTQFFARHFLLWNTSICQDRLGTNIAQTKQKVVWRPQATSTQPRLTFKEGKPTEVSRRLPLQHLRAPRPLYWKPWKTPGTQATRSLWLATRSVGAFRFPNMDPEPVLTKSSFDKKKKMNAQKVTTDLFCLPLGGCTAELVALELRALGSERGIAALVRTRCMAFAGGPAAEPALQQSPESRELTVCVVRISPCGSLFSLLVRSPSRQRWDGLPLFAHCLLVRVFWLQNTTQVYGNDIVPRLGASSVITLLDELAAHGVISIARRKWVLSYSTLRPAQSSAPYLRASLRA